jgi:hypothetical protein
MLLLLKTNDLLRGIESALGTRTSSSSFIHMSKCCVNWINSFERETKKRDYLNSLIDQDTNNSSSYKYKLVSLLSLMKFNLFSNLKEFSQIFQIYLYEWFLYVFNF